MRNHKSYLAISVIAGMFTLGLQACQSKTTSGPPTLEVQWTTDGFKDPESVMLSSDKSFLYVANIDGDGSDHDDNGYISKLAKNGKILEEKWAVGIDAPKGMALGNSNFYVSDIIRLVEIDVQTGQVLQYIPAAGSKFLNDVVFVKDLGVLVSDSATRSIYLYDGTSMKVWLTDDKLRGINGLHVDGNRILVVTMSAGELLSLNPKTKSLDVIAGGMENADGIKVLQDGSYFVSSWPGQLYHVSKTGTTTLLQDTSGDEILMNDFELEGDTIYMANLRPGTVQAIKLSQ